MVHFAAMEMFTYVQRDQVVVVSVDRWSMYRSVVVVLKCSMG